ncbi:MAG TPA: 2Fe-2S iron-sulfur cluster-binding protein [Planctomycetota bacterium]|nr:2Fe-2S iron-sulfur cluster-binding protein [Planctomycetota bacterium]
MATVSFGDVVAQAEPGRDVLSALLDVNAPIAYLCMSGTCGTCRVRVRAGMEHLEPPDPAELRRLAGGTRDERLACQAIMTGGGDVVVDQDFSRPA